MELLDYLSSCGDDGRRLLKCLQATSPINTRLEKAINSLRQHDIAAATCQLTAAREEINSTEYPFACVTQVLWRQFWTVQGFYDYLRGDLQAAQGDVSRAEEALQEICFLNNLLLPLAMEALDLATQRARIARRQAEWKLAIETVSRIRKMINNTAPLLSESRSGSSIFIADVRHFYSTLAISLDERTNLITPLRGYNDSWIGQIEEKIFHLPDLVIFY